MEGQVTVVDSDGSPTGEVGAYENTTNGIQKATYEKYAQMIWELDAMLQSQTTFNPPRKNISMRDFVSIIFMVFFVTGCGNSTRPSTGGSAAPLPRGDVNENTRSPPSSDGTSTPPGELAARQTLFDEFRPVGYIKTERMRVFTVDVLNPTKNNIRAFCDNMKSIS